MTFIDKIARYGFISVLWMAAFIVGLNGLRGNIALDIVSIILFLTAGTVSLTSGWRPSTAWDKLARYGFIGGLWVGIALLSGYAMGQFFPVSLTVIAAVFSAVAATIGLFPRYDTSETSRAAAPTEKRKNNPTSARDLLTPEDMYLLRQEIKEELKDELRHQMLRGDAYDDDEPLDALLDDRYTRAKRK